MVQRKAFGAALVGLSLLFALVSGIASTHLIATSKHNLGASGPGPIKAAAGQTTEICVFCHTPHAANMTTNLGVPLWNRTGITGATYDLYKSDYLIGLQYPSPVLLGGQSSRVCLSCHDGTVALGSVVNAPGSGLGGAIQMAASGVNFAGGMPLTAAGNLGGVGGTNLADDHPVGYLYLPGTAAGQDPELDGSRSFPWPKGVQLDPNVASVSGTPGSGGRVECKSCHDPHDNQFTKFLRVSNEFGALCKFCHTKTAYSIVLPDGTVGTGHDTSTQAFTPWTPWTGAAAPTVGKRSCLGCHKPHTAATNTPLLKGAEELTCYDAGCHGSNNPITGNTTQGSRNIMVEMNKVRAHPTNDPLYSGRHTSPYTADGTRSETPDQLGSANRHAECRDCHNPHQALKAIAKNATAATALVATRAGASPWTAGTLFAPLRISAALKGSWGVEPTFAQPLAVTSNATNFWAPTFFTKVSGATLTVEYQVCMKCHSNYVTLPAGARNIAQEINPYNSSYHGIVPLEGAYAAANSTNFFVNQNTMAQPWAGNTAYAKADAEACRTTPANCATFAASRGRVWCSDCHGSELTPAYPQASKSTTVPSGPHGSSVNNLLPAVLAAKIPPAPVGSSNADKMLIASLAPASNATPLCVRCHLTSVYVSDDTNSRMSEHRSHAGGRAPQGCLSCHMWNNPSANIGGDGLIYPHGLNRRWWTLGTTTYSATLASGSGQMVDSFLGGWYTNMNYTGKTCWTTSAGNVTPAGATPCNAHNGVGY